MTTFVDRVVLYVSAGAGGDGCSSDHLLAQTVVMVVAVVT
jgi:hypothetical protein